MKYISPLIAVTDLERSKAFYKKYLGLDVEVDFGANVVLTGGLSLQTLDSWRGFIGGLDVNFKGNDSELYFETDDFDRFVKEHSDLELVHTPYEHSWGQRTVRFYDPDGHIIEVGENMLDVVCRFQSEGMTSAEIATRMDVDEKYVLEWIKELEDKKVMNIQTRPIQPADYPLLNDFLYHAIFIPEGMEQPAYDIIYDPEIYIYVKDFGKDSDCGVVAEADEKIIGAAWTRIIPAYGHLDENTPELAISVLPEYRGRGTGTLLMNRLFELLRERGYKRTSLSVQQDNPAVRFYERLGYKVTDEKLDHAGHGDYIMVKELS